MTETKKDSSPQRSHEALTKMQVDVALKFYDNARADYQNRVRLRDSFLIAFLVAAGTLFSIDADLTAKDTNTPPHQLLFMVRILGFAATAVVSSHNVLIGAIGCYCATALAPYLQERLGEVPDQWDRSRIVLNLVEDNNRFTVNSRALSHWAIVELPSFMALALCVQSVVSGDVDQKDSVVYIAGLAVSIGAVVGTWIYIEKVRTKRLDYFGQITAAVENQSVSECVGPASTQSAPPNSP